MKRFLATVLAAGAALAATTLAASAHPHVWVVAKSSVVYAPDGSVVGIVTAILNPTEQHVFIGVGFAVPIENAAAAIGISPF